MRGAGHPEYQRLGQLAGLGRRRAGNYRNALGVGQQGSAVFQFGHRTQRRQSSACLFPHLPLRVAQGLDQGGHGGGIFVFPNNLGGGSPGSAVARREQSRRQLCQLPLFQGDCRGPPSRWGLVCRPGIKQGSQGLRVFKFPQGRRDGRPDLGFPVPAQGVQKPAHGVPRSQISQGRRRRSSYPTLDVET